MKIRFLLATTILIFASLFSGCCSPPVEQKAETPLVVYAVKSDLDVGATVAVETQFGLDSAVAVGKLTYVAMPAYKVHDRADLPTCAPDVLPLTGYDIGTYDSTIYKVHLKDQFGEGDFIVGPAVVLGVPADSMDFGGQNLRGKKYPSHLLVYDLKGDSPADSLTIFTRDAFGTLELQLGEVVSLLEPALKNEQGDLPGQKPLKCYRVANTDTLGITAQFIDQFGIPRTVVLQPVLFCDPVEKERLD